MTAGPDPPDHIGRYPITGVLGRGNFAVVYAAVDPVLDAPVAIKVLAAHHAVDVDIRQRFIAEARLLRELDTPEVVEVHDIGESDGQPYFVMPVLVGSLADRLGPAHDVVDVRRLVDELAACLRAIHDAGVVHRDIKPSNLLLRARRAQGPSDHARPRGSDAEGPPRLLHPGESLTLADLGLARRVDASTVTMAGGTAGYMAPEQRSPSTDIDPRADLFAASVIVWQTRMGADAPLPAENDPSPFARAIRQGAASDRDRRPADADAWAALLRGGLADDDNAPGRSPRSRPRPALVVAVAVAALVAISTWLIVTPDSGTSLEETAAIEAVDLTDPDILADVETGRSATGPRIIGPTTLLIGESGTYLHEDRSASSFAWQFDDGSLSSERAVTLTPTSLDPLSITLIEDRAGTVTASRLPIEVRDR
ncbi:serine/threonine-protein kinase [Euzebya tangerina]|uniref:serine/threonine-protein kinase n=1 Tax=Euzebya tangerina TaxID=591198 RepID=UPI000E3213EE|nr:serine/threonine-protein kinase [Euzebya tangerina]